MSNSAESLVSRYMSSEDEASVSLLVSADEARRRIKIRIEKVAAEVIKPFHLSRPRGNRFHLFTISGAEFGEILPDGRVHQVATALLERKKLEDAGEEAMAEFGFTPAKPNVLSRSPQEDGTFIEHRRYQGQLIRGLDFEGYFVVSATRKPTQVSWYAVDNAPAINPFPNRKLISDR